MKKYLLSLPLILSLTVLAQDVSRVAVTEQVTVCTEQTNLAGAAVGGGGGYLVGRALFGRMGGYLGAGTGALVGANVDKGQNCQLVTKIVGYKTFTVVDGKLLEGFEPVE